MFKPSLASEGQKERRHTAGQEEAEAIRHQEEVAENGQRISGSQAHGGHHFPINTLNAQKEPNPRPSMAHNVFLRLSPQLIRRKKTRLLFHRFI